MTSNLSKTLAGVLAKSIGAGPAQGGYVGVAVAPTPNSGGQMFTVLPSRHYTPPNGVGFPSPIARGFGSVFNNQLRLKAGEYITFVDDKGDVYSGKQPVSMSVLAINGKLRVHAKKGNVLMTYQVQGGRITNNISDFSGDGCFKYACAIMPRQKLQTLEEAEAVPGKYKRFTLTFPTTEYRTITIVAKDLKTALNRANKQINNQVAKGWRRPRLGEFMLKDIRFTNFRDLMHQWGSLWRPHRYRHGPAPQIEAKHAVFEIQTEKDIAIPDAYWQGGPQ